MPWNLFISLGCLITVIYSLVVVVSCLMQISTLHSEIEQISKEIHERMNRIYK